VSCEFDLAHYRELLRAAKAGGYRFAFFERGPEPGTLLLMGVGMGALWWRRKRNC